MASPPLIVHGHRLPTRLVRLIAEGRWIKPTDPGWLLALSPDTDADDVDFLTHAAMVRETASLVNITSDGRFPHMGNRSSSQLGRPVELPLLDADRAVLIGAQMGDSALALDNRTDPARVVETHWRLPGGCLWRSIAASFDAFADGIGLP